MRNLIENRNSDIQIITANQIGLIGAVVDAHRMVPVNHPHFGKHPSKYAPRGKRRAGMTCTTMRDDCSSMINGERMSRRGTSSWQTTSPCGVAGLPAAANWWASLATGRAMSS